MKNIRDSGWWNEEHKRWWLRCAWAARNKAEGIGIFHFQFYILSIDHYWRMSSIFL